MADNTTLGVMSGGDTISTDDLGTVKVQRVKVQYGPDGSATDVAQGTGLPVASDRLEATASYTATGSLISQDVGGYRWVSVQVTGTFTATLVIEQSNDNANWASLPVAQTSATGPSYSAGSALLSGFFYAGGIHCRYVRIRCSAYTSGTAVVTCEFFAVPTPVAATGVVNAPSSSLSVTGGGSSSVDGAGSTASFSAPAMVFNGAFWDRLRTPTTFKSASAASSGNTAAWTPTSGKKFRLMRFKVDVTANAALASAGILTIGFRDSTTDIGVSHDVWLPASAAGAKPSDGWSTGWIDIGNGKLSATINNVLNVDLSAALTAGQVRVIVCGTEE